MVDAVAQSLDIIIPSLLTIVYRAIPPANANAHPLQCSKECIDSARKALTMLISVGNAKLKIDKNRWSRFLNL